MKALLSIVLLSSALAVAVFSQAPAAAPPVAAAPVAATPVAAPFATQLAQSTEPQEGVCPFYFVCDEPYGVFQTLAQCRPTCSVQCSLEYTCNP